MHSDKIRKEIMNLADLIDIYYPKCGAKVRRKIIKE
jgi:hypothetical protein